MLRPLVLLACLLPGIALADKQLDVADLKPYFKSRVGRRARQALHAGRAADAVKLLRRYLKQRKVAQKPQARFLLAVALLRNKQPREAEKLLASLQQSYPLLRNYHRYHRAQALYNLRNFAAANKAAGSVDKDSVLYTDAQLLRADALLALSKQADTIPIWRQYVVSHPHGKRVGTAYYRLGRALAKAGRLAEALDHYKRVLVRAPLCRRAPDAKRAIKALVSRLKKDGKQRSRLTTNERYIQALVYYKAMRNRQSELGFATVLKDRTLSPKRRCQASYYRAKSVFKARQRDRAAPMFAAAAKACRKAKVSDLVVKSLYNHARGLSRKRDYRGAAKQFLALEKEFSKHSYADDARLRAAEMLEAVGDKKGVAKLLSTLPQRYPNGDMTRESLWRLARESYLGKKYSAALRHLDTIINKLGRAPVYYAEGQALYWKARISDKRRKRTQARRLYERCIREYPLSYYALMSFNQLRQLHRQHFNRLRRELIVPAGRRPGRWRLQLDRTQQDDPSLKRGIELARLGFGGMAARELHRAGLRIRRGSPHLWLAAVLYHHAGIWRLSHQVPRSRDSRYKLDPPLKDNYRRWVIAYPWAYPQPVAAEAKRAKIPRELVLAIMREESGFSPRIESYANAVGLMQLILPTARRAGAAFSLKNVNRKTLHDPATNIKLGAYFLGWLYKTFSSTLPLTIAGYNAGPGAVSRWIRRFRGGKLDELIEQIPYDQTRNYTKRVLASVFAYSVLYGRRGHRIPIISNRIPAPKRRSF